jgi:hypothetical protein
MKRLVWLFLVVLCSAILLNAEDNTMTGWVCDSKCVVHNGNRATCDPTCTERSGDVVFISDEGTISTISNPDVCASHMNQHVRATFAPQEQKDLDKAVTSTIRVDELRDQSVLGGGGAGAGGGGK